MAYLGSILVFIVIISTVLLFNFSNFNANTLDAFHYTNMGSLFIVILPALAFALAITSKKAIHFSFLAIMNKLPQTEDPNKIEMACLFLKVLGNVCAYMGVMIFLIDMVKFLQDLDDISQVAPSVAGALISVFYGVSFKLFFDIAEHKLKQSIYE